MKKILLSMAAIAISVSMVKAQSELPEFTQDYKKVYKKIYYDFPKEGRSSKNGGGYSVSMKLLKEPPKKVALVSFFTFDPGCTKTYSNSSDGYATTTYTTHFKQRSSGGNAGPIAAGFYYSSIDTLIAKFKSYGMELLVPEQFLDSKEKEEYYNNFKVGHGGFQYGLHNFLQAGSTANDIFGYVEGYNVLDVVSEPQTNYEKTGFLKTMGYSNKVPDNQVFLGNSDDKFMNSMGYDLAKNLGVDAVIFVYATIYMPKETKIVLQNVRMIMFGQNPIQLGENDKKPFFYHNGEFYCGASIKTETAILNKKKKDPTTDKISFEGFNIIMVALADKIGLYLTGKED